ncbi:MAG: UDP-N-acetylmuramoyl-tripeptide--D-alanyl-D-alanine ligase [Clostridia bacterium]|nr:UDP-N-acetylmuramoyl-tripeptide--D-alanyl-D-alanine ligase [Clostridia bacterium]
MRIRLDIPLKLSEIKDAICAEGNITEDTVSHIVTDSRECFSGDLFIALCGRDDNGEHYVRDAALKGAYIITTQSIDDALTVSDTLLALLELAKYYKSKLKKLKYTVAITGSVGKTTTKEFLKIICDGKYKTHATRGNENNLLGVPLTILCADADTEILILEMGMNHIGEISLLSRCAAPDISVITNIGTAHIGILKSRDNIAKAKLEIKDGMKGGRLILPYGEELLYEQERAHYFSSKSKDADIYIIYKEGNVTVFDKDGYYTAPFKPTGEHNLECLCAAVLAAEDADISKDIIARQISLISCENTRQTIIPLNKFYILADYYNASYESVRAALDQLLSLEGYTVKSALLGTVLELGDMSEEIHIKIGRYAAKKNLNNLYLYGEYAKSIREGAIDAGYPENKIFINENRDDPRRTALQISRNGTEGEIILFKASNAVRLGKVLEELKSIIHKNVKGERQDG